MGRLEGRVRRNSELRGEHAIGFGALSVEWARQEGGWGAFRMD